MLAQNEISLENFNCADDSDNVQVLLPGFHHVKSSNREVKKGKKRKTPQDDEKESHMIKAIESVASAISEGNTKAQSENYIKQNLWSDLKAVGIESSLLVEVYLHLVENPQKRIAFIGCPVEARYDLLMRMMNSSNNH